MNRETEGGKKTDEEGLSQTEEGDKKKSVPDRGGREDQVGDVN